VELHGGVAPVFTAQVKYRYGSWATVAHRATRPDAVRAAARAMERRDSYGERPLQVRVLESSAPQRGERAAPVAP
jgi:hypothetical protein